MFFEFLRDKLAITVESEPTMELRLFRMLCLSAILLIFLVIVPIDLMIHLARSVTLLDLGFGVVSIFCYRQACRGRYWLKTLFFLYLLNLNLAWFANSGSQGSCNLYFFNAFIYALIFFRGRQRWLLLGLAVADDPGIQHR